jgi:hypothetical protein
VKKKYKWWFAIGTTSRVPTREGYHYLIADFDQEDFPYKAGVLLDAMFDGRQALWEETDRGWHLYTNLVFNFKDLIKVLGWIDADPVWIKIGKERGYFFLAHKSVLKFHWPVEYMYLYHGKEKTHNARPS